MNDHTDTSLVDRLRDATDQIDLDDATRQRLREQLLRREPTAAKPARRRRMPRIAFGAALAGAAALVLLVALSPFDQSSNPDGRSTSSPAQLALLQAADAAAAQAWRPLTGDTYFHVYSTSFTPELKMNPNAPKVQGRSIEEHVVSPMNDPRSSESWIDSNGNGMHLMVDGGDPTGTTPRGMPLPEGVDIDESLAAARGTTVFAWPRDDRDGFQRNWSRIGSSFAKSSEITMAMTYGSRADERDTTEDNWGIGDEALEQLNEANASNVDELVVQALDDGVDMRQFMTIGQYGVTVNQLRQEYRIGRATGMLGAAPLSPTARSALFRWLSQQDGATIVQDDVDGVGRRGVRVTFESLYDETVPAATWTLDDLEQRARDAGVADVEDLSPSDVEGITRPRQAVPTWVIPAHREYRRAFHSLLFDEKAGELLETQTLKIEHSATSARIPHLIPSGGGMQGEPGVRVFDGNQGQGVSISFGSRLYRARERTDAIEPLSPVCREAPKVCAPERGV